MYEEFESSFEAIIRKTGNSYVITVPKEVREKISLTDSSGVSVHIKKWKKRGKE